MFHNSHKPSSDQAEGTVVQVDPIRLSCKVRTIDGRNLDYVQWAQPSGGSSRAGDRVCPSMGDRVVVDLGLGYPRISDFLPKLQDQDNSFPINIDSGSVIVDTGNYSPDGTTSFGDVNKPGDLLAGDRVIASIGGAFLAILRAGTMILRSGRLAQIVISKWDDVVKIISRNWEHYTDVSSDMVKNIQGRIYRYIGYTNSFADSKGETYKLHYYYGDTALAEAVKTNYLSLPSPLPAMNSILFKEQVTSSGSEVMHRTLTDAGTEERYITGGGGFTRQLCSSSQYTISWNDQNTITVNSPVIKLQRSDGAVVTLDSSGIHLSFSGGTVDMLSDGIHLSYSGGKIDMKSDGVHTTFGGHFVNVTSAGVQLG